MILKDRRNKEKIEMRNHILGTAKEIAAKDGWQNVTIRKICAQIQYTAPVVYQYFESKEDILLVLREEGFNQVLRDFELVITSDDNAIYQLKKYAKIWWNFSLENPEIYQVMFNLQGAICPQIDNHINPQSKMILDYYREAFRKINNKAETSDMIALELCDNFIAIIHGFIALRLANKIRSGSEREEIVFDNSIQRFIQSIL